MFTMRAALTHPDAGIIPVALPGPVLALGLMSGTSCDGIDAALVETDGERILALGARLTRPYPPGMRAALRAALGSEAPLPELEQTLTDLHAEAVTALLERAGLAASAVRVIGFHGQTILHAPERRLTRQIGDGARLAAATGIDVVNDFRSRDVAMGGEGAPFAPLFHWAMAKDLPRPLAVLNIGGVANVTWIGPDDERGNPVLLAFDTGPGNAPLDDWAQRHTGRPVDADGALARLGRADGAALAALMMHPYFARPAPKSLDRNAFDLGPLAVLSPADGAATLVAFAAEAVAAGAAHFPRAVTRWLVSGGGRRNPALMDALAARLEAPVGPVEAVDWDGDMLEAQAFAFLAVRALRGLPLSLPGTTGVSGPTTGGRLHRRPQSRGA